MGVRLTAAVGRLRQAACDIAARRGLTVDWESRLDANAVRMSPPLVGALTRAAERSAARAHVMSSGAGHDAMILAGRMPVAMLFVRSPAGISHHPDERVNEGDVAAALAAGSAFLEELTRGTRG